MSQSNIDKIDFTASCEGLMDQLENISESNSEPAKNSKKNKKSASLITRDDGQISQLIKIQLELLNLFKSFCININNTNDEIIRLKKEVLDNKKLADDSIGQLNKENTTLRHKIDDLEVHSRGNSLILSGPLIITRNNSTPADLINQSKVNIKKVYDFDLNMNDVYDCRRIPNNDDSTNDRVILTLKSPLIKNEIITKVIRKDKRNGVPLNINEYLSSKNSNLLYQLRNLRNLNKSKIYSCFSRNGRVFYKALKNSRPKLITSEDDILALSNELQNSAIPMQSRNLQNTSQNHGRNSQNAAQNHGRNSQNRNQNSQNR